MRRDIPNPPETATAAGLDVVWFGHAAGRRADGLSSYTREVTRTLVARGARVHLVTHDVDGDDVPLERSLVLRGMRLATLTVSLPGSRTQVGELLRRVRPQVAHVSWSFSNLDGAIGRLARRVGAATVATFHLPYASPRSARGRVLRRLYQYHVRNLEHFDRCVALSTTQAELLAAVGYPRDQVEVVPNGVDTELITPGPSPLAETLGARFVVLYMGRLDPEKRVTALVRSFLALDWPADHVLVIAGSGTQEARIRRLARGHPNVRVVGLVTDPRRRLDLLRAADVFVLPSTAEGLALSMLEAMAAGCAVVATDAGEDGAALGDAGIRLPVRPLEPHLSQALRRLRDDPGLRAELGARARARVVERYALGPAVDRLVSIYRGLVPSSAAAA